MKKYAGTLMPCVYDDFVEEARKYITHEQKNRLRSLYDFKLQKNPRYNLPDERLRMIEKTVEWRVKEILK